MALTGRNRTEEQALAVDRSLMSLQIAGVGEVFCFAVGCRALVGSFMFVHVSSLRMAQYFVSSAVESRLTGMPILD